MRMSEGFINSMMTLNCCIFNYMVKKGKPMFKVGHETAMVAKSLSVKQNEYVATCPIFTEQSNFYRSNISTKTSFNIYIN